MVKKPLTNKESKVMTWMKSFQQKHGGYPTYREIQSAFKFSSINSVSQYVKQLAKKGCLELLKNRGYRFPSAQLPSFVSIPLLGSVQAGLPNDTQEVEERITVPEGMVQSPHRSFALRVRGTSMTDAGLEEGDTILVDPGQKAKVGDMVIASVEGETTVKRLQKDAKKGVMYLKAESAFHQDIYPDQPWEIQGVVVSMLRTF
ncbi:MAG: transcriptional repressor LexA [bacterium]|nr:transcriptional repressor LexA [bacterium]